MMALIQTLLLLLLTAHLMGAEARKIKENGTADTEEPSREDYVVNSIFRLYSEGEDFEDTCELEASLTPRTFASCGFNSSNPLVIIAHGWSLNGVMESWVMRLATALKTSLVEVNVVITDWIRLAHHHYPVAAKNTRQVGQDIAHFLRTIEELYQIPAKRVHLIGYSLGAHICGFVGSHLGGSRKIGRITGLDPAGPLFEGMSAVDRLSPDDAHFVDAIHTFTKESMGLSVGIKQPVAHYDFYPNGGDFQPGCDLGANLYDHISEYGLLGFEQTVKCAHERSVHLFIDSLLNKDQQSTAYRCSSNKAFEQGSCLDCRKNRCNTLGYGVKVVRSGRSGASKRLYLKTRSRMPYKLYHHQFKVQFVNPMEVVHPSLTISLTGTREQSEELPIRFDEISGNKTYTFLITLDKDIGHLMMLRFRWEGVALWKSMWSRAKSLIPWGGARSRPQLTVGRISVKAGDTQERTSFCAMTDEGQHIEASQEKVFVRCQDDAPGGKDVRKHQTRRPINPPAAPRPKQSRPTRVLPRVPTTQTLTRVLPRVPTTQTLTRVLPRVPTTQTLTRVLPRVPTTQTLTRVLPRVPTTQTLTRVLPRVPTTQTLTRVLPRVPTTQTLTRVLPRVPTTQTLTRVLPRVPTTQTLTRVLPRVPTTQTLTRVLPRVPTTQTLTRVLPRVPTTQTLTRVLPRVPTTQTLTRVLPRVPTTQTPTQRPTSPPTQPSATQAQNQHHNHHHHHQHHPKQPAQTPTQGLAQTPTQGLAQTPTQGPTNPPNQAPTQPPTQAQNHHHHHHHNNHHHPQQPAVQPKKKPCH